MKRINNKNLRIILFLILSLILLSVTIPFFLEFFVWRNQVYSAINNSDWSAFLGSYLGGVIGGAATLLALWITTIESKDNQHKAFLDRIISMCATFIQNINSIQVIVTNINHIICELKETETNICNINQNLSNQNSMSPRVQSSLETEYDYEMRYFETNTQQYKYLLEKYHKIEDTMTHSVLVLELYLKDINCAQKLLGNILEIYKIALSIKKDLENEKPIEDESTLKKLTGDEIRKLAEEFVKEYKNQQFFS